MPFSASTPDISAGFTPPVRPKFNHQNTADRLREGSIEGPAFPMSNKRSRERKSMFKELGLDTSETATAAPSEQPTAKDFAELTGLASPSAQTIAESGEDDEIGARREKEVGSPPHSPVPSPSSPTEKRWYNKLTTAKRPRIKATASAPPSAMAGLSRMTTIVVLIAVVLPGFSYYNGREKVKIYGADAGPINRPASLREPWLDTRANSPTDVCTRWSQQTALLNGTLYIYGGQAKTSSDQTNDTWNNNFLTLDLTKSWQVSSPALTELSQPSGPPAVANGYLWNDYNNLFLYGGECADNPPASPAPISTWRYSISSQSWTEYASPKTSAGNFSDSGGIPVQRAAEGAGLSVPELGLSWYFGGHLDWATTPGWSNQVARVYLKSLLEFTHPGYANDGVQSLVSAGASDGGAYRNITQGGLQQSDPGFYERADGALVFIPGWGAKGVLIGLAGGTADVFSNDLSTLDVYDIATSTWYHQKTSGDAPSVRVNLCAVVASAPDASSFQVYVFGGQNLQPYKQQTQYSDMYILSIPAFAWIKVDQTGTNQPAPRAGHTCNLRDGQMVVVGGYVGTSIPCDSPGIYVFNASSLQWQSSFTALDHAADLHPENSVLANSFGYRVPDAVARVIGGSSDGGATATTPAAGGATQGPFATGKSPVFTVTASGGAGPTVTQWSPGATTTATAPGSSGGGSGSGGPASSPAADGSADSRRPGLIAAGVIAGLAGLAALYLGYCTWIYRRQVRAYKTHLAVANRYSPAGASGTSFGGLAAFFGRKGSKESRKGAHPAAAAAGRAAGNRPLDEKQALSQERGRGRGHFRDNSASTAGSIGGLVPMEPKSLFDSNAPSPGSGYSSSSPARPPPGYTGPYSGHPHTLFGVESSGSGSGTGTTPGSAPRRRRDSDGSSSSTEGLLDGQEPSFFSVVLGPRRALRVVNGLEGEGETTAAGGAGPGSRAGPQSER